MKFANIIVDISHEKLDRPFGYIIPERLMNRVQVGTAVKIPFGKGNRLISGYVIEITDKPGFDISKMKEIDSVAEGATSVESGLIQLAWWMKENYGSTMNQALKTVIPVKKTVKGVEKKTVVLKLTDEEVEQKLNLYQQKNAKARVRLLEELKTVKRLSKNLVVNKLNISASTLKTMEQLGDIVIQSDTDYRKPIKLEKQKAYDIVLNKQQRDVSENIKKTMLFCKDTKPNIHLIHGITGS